LAKIWKAVIIELVKIMVHCINREKTCGKI
jgi:hypothetical protein